MGCGVGDIQVSFSPVVQPFSVRERGKSWLGNQEEERDAVTAY